VHPSRLVSVCFLLVGVLLLVDAGVSGEFRSLGAVLRISGGAVLTVGGLYGAARYEESPIVTEYGAVTYLLLLGFGLWAVGLLAQILTGLS